MKRWYQLSMLQLLVAMAVVAVFISKNITTQEYVESVGLSADRDRSESMDADAGWPFVYWHSRMRVEPSQFYWSIVGNIATCALVVVGSVAFVSLLEEHSQQNVSIATIKSLVRMSKLQFCAGVAVLKVFCWLNLPEKYAYAITDGGGVLGTRAGFPIKYGDWNRSDWWGRIRIQDAPSFVPILRWDAFGSNLLFGACATFLVVRCVGSWEKRTSKYPSP